MNIAILGFGVVARGTCEILKNRKEKDINVAKVLRRNMGSTKQVANDAKFLKPISKTAPSKIFTCDIKDIIKTKSIDTVVECIGGDDIPYSFCEAAMKAKKNVVTSNKKMLAKYYKKLITLAKTKKVLLLFEASVCGGIPFINTLSNMSNVSGINSINGIMNGTSNYILYKMFEEDLSFEEALKGAQELGYAEADPSDDIDGIDTKNKILISSNLAFKTVNNLKDVHAFGIRNIDISDISFCKKHKLVCKLIASASLVGNKKSQILIDVFPTFLSNKDSFANISLNNNMVRINSFGLGSIDLVGAGAGSLPTGTAVVSDLLLLNDGKEYKAEISKNIKINNEQNICDIYFRNDSSIEKDELINFIESLTKNDITVSNFNLKDDDIERLKLERENGKDIVVYTTSNTNTYLIFGLNVIQIDKLSKKFNKAFIAKI